MACFCITVILYTSQWTIITDTRIWLYIVQSARQTWCILCGKPSFLFCTNYQNFIFLYNSLVISFSTLPNFKQLLKRCLSMIAT